MKLYKLVSQEYTTYDGAMRWEIGKTNSLEPCDNPGLCTETVIHAYRSWELGLFLNPIHANLPNPRLLECDGEICVEDWGKCGVFSLTPVREMEVPEVTTERRVLFAIKCAETVLDVYEGKYPDDDRPRKAIEAARKYLNNPSQKTAHAARAAAHAADSAEAAHAARAAHAAAHAAHAAAHAARAAAHAARAAAHAARAARAAADIDFNTIAKEVLA